MDGKSPRRIWLGVFGQWEELDSISRAEGKELERISRVEILGKLVSQDSLLKLS